MRGHTRYIRRNRRSRADPATPRTPSPALAHINRVEGSIHVLKRSAPPPSATMENLPHSGASFYSDDTEFTLVVYISASGGFDANQTYRLRLRFDGMSNRVSIGSPATATITVGGS